VWGRQAAAGVGEVLPPHWRGVQALANVGPGVVICVSFSISVLPTTLSSFTHLSHMLYHTHELSCGTCLSSSFHILIISASRYASQFLFFSLFLFFLSMFLFSPCVSLGQCIILPLTDHLGSQLPATAFLSVLPIISNYGFWQVVLLKAYITKNASSNIASSLMWTDPIQTTCIERKR
jgi:hypothetical protein